jgi:hypothetical protein
MLLVIWAVTLAGAALPPLTGDGIGARWIDAGAGEVTDGVSDLMIVAATDVASRSAGSLGEDTRIVDAAGAGLSDWALRMRATVDRFPILR